MIRTRVIPVLLLKGRGLVKTTQFKDPVYVGDPINAVRIFNDKEVDELTILDIDATKNNREPNYELLQEIVSECFIPLCYGGGVTRFEQIEKLFSLGIEKVALNSVLAEKPELLSEGAKTYGSQSLIASIDYKKNFFGKYRVVTHGGQNALKEEPLEFAKRMEDLGAGEIILNSVDKDGTRSGYDLEMIAKVSSHLSIPVVAAGGAGELADFKKAADAGASAAAAGSLFVFHGKLRGVLISYPSQDQLEALLG
jgi:cyclase